MSIKWFSLLYVTPLRLYAKSQTGVSQSTLFEQCKKLSTNNVRLQFMFLVDDSNLNKFWSFSPTNCHFEYPLKIHAGPHLHQSWYFFNRLGWICYCETETSCGGGTLIPVLKNGFIMTSALFLLKFWSSLPANRCKLSYWCSTRRSTPSLFWLYSWLRRGDKIHNQWV